MYSYYLIVVAMACNTMLNKCDESGHPCLVPEFNEKVFSFSQLSLMLVVGFCPKWILTFIIYQMVLSNALRS